MSIRLSFFQESLFPKEFLFKSLGDIDRKEILDFGCGEGEISTQLAKLGARVTALDISPELIAIPERRAGLDGIRGQIEFVVQDISESPLRGNKFDFVIGYAVLHHLEIKNTLPRILDCIRGGKAFFVEPIAFSRSHRKIRDFVPIKKNTSPGERQLNKGELNFIRKRLANCSVTYFNLFGRLQRLFPNKDKMDKGHLFTKAALMLLHSFDRLLLNSFPSLSRYCGIAVIVGEKPSFGHE